MNYCWRIYYQVLGVLFPYVSSLGFFAFKEGMWDTQISALGGWPTVSGGFVRLVGRAKKPLGEELLHIGGRKSTVVSL